MFKPQRGVIVVITLVFLLLTSLVFSNLSAQIVQANKLLFGLQDQVKQVLAYRSARSHLAGQLATLPLVQILSELSQAIQDVKGAKRIRDFASQAKCAQANSLQWRPLALAHSQNKFYLNLVSHTEDAKSSISFIFVILTCLASQLDFNEVTQVEVYHLDSRNNLTSLYFDIITEPRSEL